MMRNSIKSFLLFAVIGIVRAVDRDLALATIYSYQPNTKVTDENALDKDTRALIDAANLHTADGFAQAKNIYLNGGSTGSYAVLKIPNQNFRRIKAGTRVTGTSVNGPAVSGTVLEQTAYFATSVKVLYDVSEVQSDYVKCRVGGLTTKQLDGCFKSTGTVQIGGRGVSYSYAPDVDNKNLVTLGGFSTHAKTNYKIGGKYFPIFQNFLDFFGTPSYGYEIFIAALQNKTITLNKMMFDFVRFNSPDADEAVSETIRKSTQYIVVTMQIISELEKAIADCSSCTSVTCSAVHHLDKAVAYYTGSLEGTDGNGTGVSLLQAGDSRCGAFKTCGPYRNQTTGIGKTSLDAFVAFISLKSNLVTKQCTAATTNKNTIISIIWTILIQGATRYAYVKVNTPGANLHEEAEGMMFTAALVPVVNACNTTSATTLVTEMSIGKFNTTNVGKVKKAFESVYSCLGIKCSMVGGFYAGSGYYPGMEPCTSP